MARFDIILKNGLLIDPARSIHRIQSIGIKNRRIDAVSDNLPDDTSEMTYDLSGKIVTPGLIDLHCHPAKEFAELGLDESEIGLFSGVTLLCDAGTAGSYNFQAFRKFVVDLSQTDILCFLNLANTGLVKMPEICSAQDIDLGHTQAIIDSNRDIIKGIKFRLTETFSHGLGIKGVESAKTLSKKVGLPLMVHIGETRPRQLNDQMDDFTRTAVSFLEEGDIISHFLTWEPGGLILRDGTVYPELIAAQKRGVVLDACHGLNHFSLTVARQAIAQGILPTVISTDLCTVVIPSAQSLAVVMSKFLNLGLSLDQVIEMTTINPAKALSEDQTRGSIEPGRIADISVLELIEGDFQYTDGNGGESMTGKLLLEPRMTIKNGNPTPAFSRYHIAPAFDDGR